LYRTLPHILLYRTLPHILRRLSLGFYVTQDRFSPCYMANEISRIRKSHRCFTGPWIRYVWQPQIYCTTGSKLIH